VLGASDAAWNAAHTTDPEAEPGVAYDPAQGLANGAHDRFTGVMHANGRVTNFDLGLPPSTTIRQAVAAAMSVLPKDARHGPVTKLDVCAVMSIHSATLQQTLGSPDAFANFASGAAEDHYDPTAVSDVVIASATSGVASGAGLPKSC
jgi:hypothetical protein